MLERIEAQTARDWPIPGARVVGCGVRDLIYRSRCFARLIDFRLIDNQYPDYIRIFTPTATSSAAVVIESRSSHFDLPLSDSTLQYGRLREFFATTTAQSLFHRRSLRRPSTLLCEFSKVESRQDNGCKCFAGQSRCSAGFETCQFVRAYRGGVRIVNGGRAAGCLEILGGTRFEGTELRSR